MGLTDVVFFENDHIAERVSRSLLDTAEREGLPAKLTRFFRQWERAVPATGRGRDSRGAGIRAIPSDEPSGAEIGRAGTKQKHRADRKKTDFA